MGPPEWALSLETTLHNILVQVGRVSTEMEVIKARVHTHMEQVNTRIAQIEKRLETANATAAAAMTMATTAAAGRGAGGGSGKGSGSGGGGARGGNGRGSASNLVTSTFNRRHISSMFPSDNTSRVLSKQGAEGTSYTSTRDFFGEKET